MYDLPDLTGLAWFVAIGMLSSCAGVLWLIYFLACHIRFV